MSLVINTNTAALSSQRSLLVTQAQQAQTFQRLATGLRVNSARDDAAGLYLAQSQTKDIRGLNMATRNAADGISMAQTAEGALDQIQSNLQRINELAIQSANGTYNQAARNGLQKEVDQLTQEIKRIVETTEFNGQKILHNSAQAQTLQIGFNNTENARISTGLEGGIIGAMDGEAVEGTHPAVQTAIDAANAAAADTDLASEKQSYWTTVAWAWAAEPASAVSAWELAFNNGFFDVASLDIADAMKSAFEAANNDAFDSWGSAYGQTGEYFLNAAAGLMDSYSAASAAETNAKNAFVAAANALAGMASPNEIHNFSSDGGDLDNALTNVINGNLDAKNTINISNQAGARRAIETTRTAIDFVSELRADFGAKINRFEAVISGNQIYSENLAAARSRVQDTDFAVETSALAKQQILQQAGVAALGQANASAQVVLGLL